jgi:hypothetical protein
VFNDVGIVIDTLRGQFGVKRIAYVDIDVHHGDGLYYPTRRTRISSTPTFTRTGARFTRAPATRTRSARARRKAPR